MCPPAKRGSKSAADDPPAKGKGSRKSSAGSDAGSNGAEDHSAVLAALEEGLEEALPGFEVHDRELEFAEERTAALAGVDATGRLVLVLVVDDDGERGVLDTLDALAFARRDTALLARHLGASRLRTDLDPRVVLVLAQRDDLLTDRLRPLLGNEVEAFEIRSLRSAAGERSYLAPLAGGQHQDAGTGPTADAFLAALPEPLKDLGMVLVHRMERLDEDRATRSGPASVVWSFQGDVLARIERSGDRLNAGIAPTFASIDIAHEEDIESFVEAALERLVELIGSEPASELLERTLQPPGDELLLTPEEIEAFRE
jgi:hypothetical protein